MVAFCIALSLPDALQIDNWIVNGAPLRKRANCSGYPNVACRLKIEQLPAEHFFWFNLCWWLFRFTEFTHGISSFVVYWMLGISVARINLHASKLL
jgi:hypothetical protein